MKYKVHILSDAEEDIFNIYKYIAINDSVQKAENLLGKLEESINTLINFANRGHIPPELERIGISEYQEIHYKPYRIIYQTIGPDVFVHCVLDRRRELEELLHERLLR